MADSLPYDEVQNLVHANNHCTFKRTHAPADYHPPPVQDEVIISIAWMESNFRPKITNPHSDAVGLMQLRKASVDTVNHNTPQGIHFNYPDDLFDPAKAIACATYLLAIKIESTHGDIRKGIANYGEGDSYADKILECAACIMKLEPPHTPMWCLQNILHS